MGTRRGRLQMRPGPLNARPHRPGPEEADQLVREDDWLRAELDCLRPQASSRVRKGQSRQVGSGHQDASKAGGAYDPAAAPHDDRLSRGAAGGCLASESVGGYATMVDPWDYRIVVLLHRARRPLRGIRRGGWPAVS